MQVNLDTRKLTSLALVAFIVGGTLGGLLFNIGGIYVPSSNLSQVFGNMKRFTSYDELKDYLTEYSSGDSRYYNSRGLGFPTLSFDMAMSGDGKAVQAPEAGTSTDYSLTNIQVEGVDEADVVKTDGEYVYYVKGTQIIIIKAYPTEEVGIVTRINTENYITDIYVSSNRLVAFASSGYYYYNDYLEEDVQKGPQTTLTVYDISDKENPKKSAAVSMKIIFIPSIVS